MKVLNLYAGIGGNRKLWEGVNVTAVEIDEDTGGVYQEYFPEDELIIGDAHEYLLHHYDEFDFIWSSPPCPTHSDIRRCGVHQGQNDAMYTDMTLYQEVILLRHFAPEGMPWVVENVVPYYKPLIPAEKVHRHMFWSNFKIGRVDVDRGKGHQSITAGDTIYGFNIIGTTIQNKRKVLRNMVHPDLGKHILNRATDVLQGNIVSQGALFNQA